MRANEETHTKQKRNNTKKDDFFVCVSFRSQPISVEQGWGVPTHTHTHTLTQTRRREKEEEKKQDGGENLRRASLKLDLLPVRRCVCASVRFQTTRWRSVAPERERKKRREREREKEIERNPLGVEGGG